MGKPMSCTWNIGRAWEVVSLLPMIRLGFKMTGTRDACIMCRPTSGMGDRKWFLMHGCCLRGGRTQSVTDLCTTSNGWTARMICRGWASLTSPPLSSSLLWLVILKFYSNVCSTTCDNTPIHSWCKLDLQFPFAVVDEWKCSELVRMVGKIWV